jgi:hypothetical protein
MRSWRIDVEEYPLGANNLARASIENGETKEGIVQLEPVFPTDGCD